MTNTLISKGKHFRLIKFNSITIFVILMLVNVTFFLSKTCAKLRFTKELSWLNAGRLPLNTTHRQLLVGYKSFLQFELNNFGSFAQETLEIYARHPLKIDTTVDIFLPLNPGGTPVLIIQAHEWLRLGRGRHLSRHCENSQMYMNPPSSIF